MITLRVRSPNKFRLQAVRRAYSAQLPGWLSPESSDSEPEAMALVSLLAELTLGLQLEARVPISSIKHIWSASNSSGTQGPVTLHLALANTDLHFTTKSLDWALAALNTAMSQQAGLPVPFVSAFLSSFAGPKGAGVNRFFIVQAADTLKIPRFELGAGLMSLGTGQYRRWLKSLVSDATSALGMRIARDKLLTAKVLRMAGLPGAENALVRTPDHAVQVATTMGFPVVVKPADSDRGQGVAADLRQAGEVVEAFKQASSVSPNVLVEKWVAGQTHRITVQQGQVIRVVKRIAGGVTGDGSQTIVKLIELFQKTPQQVRMARQLGRQPLALDEEALTLLRRAGLDGSYVPAKGEYVRLRLRDNINAGGTNIEIPTDDPSQLHPDNARLAVEAANVLQLDFAGIDFITTDASRSWEEVGGLICEINAEPQMGGWNDPYLYQRVLERLFSGPTCIHATLIVVGSGAGRHDQLLADALATDDLAKVSTSEGVWHKGLRQPGRFQDSFESARAVLLGRDSQRAICIMRVQDVFDHGLPMANWNSIVFDEQSFVSQEEMKLKNSVQRWPALAV